MGIPKFFRWLSERYPLINKRISGTFIPEFDNLYLDMKGILHTCTHPSDARISEPLTEEEMTTRIFHYVDKIVQVIQPRRTLFLSIDGVAPMAKLNQHRQRRFRSAKDLQEAIENMKSKGQTPPENIFDSNSITAGSEFLQQLSQSLQYFIRKKIDEDALWQNISIVYSGPEVPGEGEHKIMEWLRQQKAAGLLPNNTRHCLYGLDADLIILGLCSHEHYFALLREDVLTRRGRFKDDIFKTPSQVDALEFQLLHLSLVREYLDLEFRNGNLPFGYDLERVIDDFVLMCFLVGNDFLPQLPGLEINDGALNKIFDLYKDILPTLGGYLTNAGEMNLEYCQLFFNKLSSLEEETLLSQDLETEDSKGRTTDDSEDKDDSEENENKVAEKSSSLLSSDAVKALKADGNWKNTYYLTRFKTDPSPTFLHSIGKSYLEGLQWSLAYYFYGTPSWTWYYPYHYAPLVGDLNNLKGFEAIQPFSNVEPMKPLLQLICLLPPFSSSILPSSYRPLLTSSEISEYYPIDFDVDMTGKRNPWEGISLIPFVDVQKIENSLKSAEEKVPLTSTEALRNQVGTPLVFTFTGNSEERPSEYSQQTPLNGHFPSLGNNVASCTSYISPTLTQQDIRNAFRWKEGSPKPSGLPCFPTLSTIPFTEKLYHVGVTVFGGGGSRNESLVLDLKPKDSPQVEDDSYTSNLSKKLLGKSLFVDWPYHREGLVVGVSDRHFKYTKSAITPVPDDDASWEKEARLQHSHFLYKKGIDVGEVKHLLHIQLLKGVLNHTDGSRTKIWSDQEQTRPYQVSVENLPERYIDPRYEEKKPLPTEEMFPTGKPVIILERGPHYGQQGRVVEIQQKDDETLIQVEYEPGLLGEPNFGHRLSLQNQDTYSPLHIVSKRLGISPRVLSKVTGSIYVEPGRRNMGLNIKFTGKNQQVQGYTRKVERSGGSLMSSSPNPSGDAAFLRYPASGASSIVNSYSNVGLLGSIERPPPAPSPSSVSDILLKQDTWEFSEKAIKLIETYKNKFPEFFDAIERSVYEDTLISVGLFPDGDHERKIREIQDWLRAQDTASLPRVPCKGSLCMSDKALAAVQEASSKYHSFLAPVNKKKTLVRGAFQPSSLFPLPVTYDNNSGGPHYQALEHSSSTTTTPASPLAAVPTTSLSVSQFLTASPRPAREDQVSAEGYKLGDRVMNLRPTGFVPFGLKGTVVELVYRSASVLFDTEFLGGTTLNRRCKTFRGLSGIPLRELLNLSQGTLSEEEVASQTELISPATPLLSQGHVSHFGLPNNAAMAFGQTLRRSFDGFSSYGQGLRTGPPPGVHSPAGSGLRPRDPVAIGTPNSSRYLNDKSLNRSSGTVPFSPSQIHHPTLPPQNTLFSDKDWAGLGGYGGAGAGSVSSILEEEEDDMNPLIEETTASISSILDEDDISPISGIPKESLFQQQRSTPSPMFPDPNEKKSQIDSNDVWSDGAPPGLGAPSSQPRHPQKPYGRGKKYDYPQKSHGQEGFPIYGQGSHLNWQQQALLQNPQPSGSIHPHHQQHNQPHSYNHSQQQGVPHPHGHHGHSHGHGHPGAQRGTGRRPPYSQSQSSSSATTSNAYSNLETLESQQPSQRGGRQNRKTWNQRPQNSPPYISTNTTAPTPIPPTPTAQTTVPTPPQNTTQAQPPRTQPQNQTQGAPTNQPPRRQKTRGKKPNQPKNEEPKQNQNNRNNTAPNQLTWQQKQFS